MSDSRKRLPGSEKLTRPEDIKALSKYLGEIKRIQEEHTSLEKDTLEVPGITTGFLPDITSLPDSAVGLEAGGDVSSLDSTSIGLDVNKEVGLSDFIETLEANKDVTLDERRVNLEGDQKEIKLSETKIELSDTEKELGLSEKRVDLENAASDELNLSEFKEILEVDKDQELSETKVNLEVNDEVELSDKRIGLEDDREVELGETRINLEDNRDIELGDKRINLEDIKEVELDNTRIDLEDNRNIELDDKKINLEDIKEVELDNTRINLEDNKDTKLDNTLVNIEDGRETELSETRINIEDNRNIELGDKKINLENIKEVELDDTRINLEDNRETELDNTLVDIEDKRETELSETRIDIEDKRDTQLDNTRLDLEANKDSELDNTRIGLKVEDNTELDNTLIKVDDSRQQDLDDSIIGLETNHEVEELSSERLDIEAKEDIDLSDTRIDLNAKGDVELEKTRVDIEASDDIDLSDYLDELLAEDNTKSLSDTIIKGPEKVEVEQLYDSVLSGPEKVEPDDLSDTKIELLAEEKVEELYNKEDRIGLDAKEIVENLYDSKLRMPDDTSEEGWNGEELYDSLLKAPNDAKYQKILELAAQMGNWGAKIAALTSSVLSGDGSISSDRASWYDAELKKLLYQMGALTVAHKVKARADGTSNDKAEELANDLANGDIDPEDGNPKSENEILAKYQDEKTLVPHETKIGADGSSNDKAGYLASTEGEAASRLFQNIREEGIVTRPAAANSDTYITDSGNPKEEKEYSLAEKLIGLYENPYSKDTNTQGFPTVPGYQLPARGLLDALNISNYIRFGAEELFKLWDPKTVAERKIKGILLNETIALLVIAREQLERLSKANRDRLPGDDAGLLSDLVSGGASGAVGNLVGNVKSAIQNTFAGVSGVDKTNPLNRPKTKRVFTPGDGQAGANVVKQPTESFEFGNDRDEVLEENGLGKNLGKNLVNALVGDLADDKLNGKGLSFKKRYIEGSTGMAITLMDLCNIDSSQKNQLGSVEQLQELLKQSPYITTPGKFGTSEIGKYKTMTLDTNAYWEVTIEPFCHYTMNGGYSFLPAIQEINWQNAITHGSWEQGDKRRTVTSYQKWVPIIGFELEKSRLTTKSLGLYDGEINYPISSELTNELRMTIADDQYKSWRNYFQKCADVAVYSSEAHDKNYYDVVNNDLTGNEFNGSGTTLSGLYAASVRKGLKDADGVPTVVDKSRIAVASYKNITFRIKIYIMTPQYSTIRRFDLLCVLRDFQESYSGDIDAGGYDLNVSFSIVGENPPNEGEYSDNNRYLKLGVSKNNKANLSDGTKTVNKSSSLIKLL